MKHCDACGETFTGSECAQKPHAEFREYLHKACAGDTGRYTESEWATITDLRKNWGAFCDADPFEGRDTFTERMEAAGFITMRTATKRDVEATSFPEELGIVAGQPIWVLTKKGLAVIGED